MRNAIPDDVKAKIAEVVKNRMGRFGGIVKTIKPGIDSIGEDVIDIEVVYGQSEDVISINILSRLISDTIRLLIEAGEDRYPRYDHRFQPDQKFKAA